MISLEYPNGIVVPLNDLPRVQLVFHRNGWMSFRLADSSIRLLIVHGERRDDRLEVASSGALTPDHAENIATACCVMMGGMLSLKTLTAPKQCVARFALVPSRTGALRRVALERPPVNTPRSSPRRRKKCYRIFLAQLEQRFEEEQVVTVRAVGHTLMEQGHLTYPEWQYCIKTSELDGAWTKYGANEGVHYTRRQIHISQIRYLLAHVKFR